MEPISEERQRKVYEWACPDLKGKDWTLMGSRTGEPWAHWPGHFRPLSKMTLPALYVRDSSGNWQPNYQWFCVDAEAQLLKEGYEVNKYGKNWGIGFDNRWYWNGDNDPIAALAEYVEAK